MSRGRIGQEEAPKFTQPLKSVSVKEGQTATLQAELKGHPEPTIKWFKDDKELKSSPKYSISFAKGKCVLKVSKTSAKDDGQYKCTAENKCGNAMCSATLQVQGTAPTEEVKPQPPPQEQPVQQQPQQKEESAPPPQVEKKVEQAQPPPPQPQPEVKPSPPPAEVKKPEAEVKPPPPQPQPQVQQQPQQQVQQKPPQPAQAKLTVQVQQKPPQPAQKVEQPKPTPQVQQTIEIKMAAPTEAAAPKPAAPPPPAVTSLPAFTKTLSDITVKEGNPVKLECAVKGQPQPEVKWYREGALLTSSPDFVIKYQNGVSTLTIPEIFYDDAGQYACAASNSKGTKSTSCNVRVLPGTPPPSAQQPQPPVAMNAVNDTEAEKPGAKLPIGPPEFTKPLLPARYMEGGRCRFSCNIRGNPAPKITWLRHGQPIESGYRFVIKYDEKTGLATLDITMMLLEDKGEFTCIAKSKAGQVYLTAPLLAPAQYDKWAEEYEEQKAIEKSKKKKDIVNKELETKVQEKGGKITPSQATYQDVEQTTRLSPFERRLMKEVEIREQEAGPRPGPRADQDAKLTSFESRLEKEIRFRERKSSQDYDVPDAGPFDVATFEASLLNQKQPQENESMEAETETELESELETSEASQQKAPRFLKELKNFRVSEGGKIALSCRVEGRPKPSIQWFKDGYPLPKSTRYDLSYMEGFSQFHIDVVLPDDQGAYTVFAWNKFGKAVNTGLIKVDRSKSDEVSHMRGALGARVSMETEEYQLPDRGRQPGEVREKHYKPTFKVIPSDLEVKEGKLARFNCRVTGRPPPDLTWYRNEMPVYPDANHRVLVNEGGEHALMISHARPQDGGTYTCIATNRAGEAKFHVKLHVDPKRQLVAPSFIDRVENVTVRENEPVTLTCKVSGCPTPHVSWQRDQKHIMPNAGGYRMQMSEDGVCQLFIEKVTRHDSAWYTCTAHNSAGRVSCRSRVQVIYDKLIKDNEPAPIFQRRPTQSKKPPPPPEKEEIPSYVTQYDETGDADKKPSIKPEFVVPLNDNLKKKEGSSAHFACRLQPAGDPTMRIEWFKNNYPLFIGSRVQTKYEFGICSLDIKGVYPEDAGTITCRATNKYGQTETTGKLTCEAEQSLILDTQLPEEMRGIEKTIKFDEYLSAGDFPDDSKFPSEEFCRPELVTVPEPVSVMEGENARFSCRVSGVPQPRISWFREDLQIIGQGTRMRSWFDGIHYMEITKARVADSGVIRLVARNKLGMVEFKTKLEVKAKDVAPMQLKPTPKEEKVPQPKPKIPGVQKTQPARPQYQQPMPAQTQQVQQAPSFLAAPPMMTVGLPGEPVRISCRVSGFPEPKVIWSKDGRLLSSVPRMKILQDEDIHTLLILECLPEDAGNYTIEIVSSSGKKTHCFRIDVEGDKPDDFEPHYPGQGYLHPEVKPIGHATLPEFRSVLTDCVVPDGSPVELSCEVVGTPPPVINWYHNGGMIKPSRYFRMSYDDGIARLQINEVFQEDAGEYVCEAFNNAGRVSCSGVLSVQVEEIESAAEFAVPPKFLKKIVNLEVAEGSPARFECKVVGSPRPEVQWFHEGKEIQSMPHKRVSTGPDGTSTLYIPQVFADDSGRISVTASNPAGQVSCTSQLLVEEELPKPGEKAEVVLSVEQEAPKDIEIIISPPEFIQPIVDIEVAEGDDVKFMAQVTGSQPITITWYQETKPIQESPEFKIAFDGKTCSLEVPEVLPEDAGKYTCKAANPAGEVTSTAVLTIKAFPSSPGEKGDEEKPVEDVPKPKDEKKPETKVLKPEVEEKTEKLTQEILVEKTPKEILAEELEEAARGEQPELMPPKFIQPIETVVAGDGDAVKFTAKVTGKPRPEVTWYVDETEIKDEPEYEVAFTDDGIATLTLPEVIPEDEGMYLCKAVNEVGIATCSAELFVEEEASTEVETEVEVATTQKVITVTKEVEQTVIKEEEVIEEMPVAEVKIEALESVMVIEPTEPKTYIALGNYLAESDEVMSLREGEQVTILDDGHGEWWMARRETTGEEGWVPKGYLATAEQYDEHLRSQLEEVVKEMSIDGTPFEGKAVAPEIIEPLQTTKAKDGKPVTLQCRIKGTPMPTVAWFRQSTQIPATEEFKMATDGDIVTLTIEEVYPEDSGKYTCVAKNQAGTASTSAELLVEVALSDAESDGTPSRKSLSRESTIEEGEGIKPAFMTVAKSQVVSSGKEKVTFEFRLIAAPRPQIQWFKDDQPIEETPRRRMSMYADVHLYILTLELTDIEPDDEGKYRIVATNKEGKAVASVSLEVTREEPEPPKFIEPIQTATVVEGDMARFECMVTGRPMPEITWFHGEKMIKPSDLIEIGQDKEGRNWVVVRKAMPELLGTFTCWAENQVGRTMCGAELTLTSEAEESSIVSVDSSAIVEGPQSRDLVSVDFEGADELEEEGVPPSFVMPVQDVEVKPGETAHLRVKVAGKPTPEVTWYRDGKVLQPSPRHTIMSDTEGNASLVISEAMPGDDADYLCKAVNPFGVVSCRADVIVDEEPSEVKRDKPAILVQAEKGIPLEAEVQPQGPVEVALEVRGKDLEIASISEAPSITSEEALETDIEEKEEEEAEAAKPEDKFREDVQIEIQLEDLEKHPEEVIVEVTKKMEEKPLRQEIVMPVEVTPTKEEVTLAPTEMPEQKAPVFTQPLTSAELKPGETAEITCKVEGQPRPEVQWFVDDKPIEPDSHYQTEYRPDGVCVLTIHDVESMDEGQYVVKAVNPVGVASTESELFVEVPGKMAPVKVEAKPTMDVEKPLETVPKQEAAVVEEQVEPIEKKPTEAAPEVMPQFQLEPTQKETAEVYEAPKFVEDMVDLEIIKGHPARFDVQVSGIPMPTLHWYRNGKEIKPDDKHVRFEFAEDEGIGSLIIDEVRADDDAEYACKASNKAGSAVSKADLFLQAAHKKRPEKHPPKFIVEMKSLTAVEGDSINFFCQVVGRPMPEIKWFKNGVELTLGPRISIDYDEQGICTLLIRNTTMDDVATYTCKAVNEIGEATTTAELILEGTLHHHIVEHKNSVYRIYL